MPLAGTGNMRYNGGMGEIMTNKQAFNILAAKMDEREKPLEIIRELKAAGVAIPEKYKHLEVMAGRKHWRRDPKIVETVKKAARKAAKNERAGKQG